MSYDKLLRDTAILSLASLKPSMSREQRAQLIDKAVQQLMSDFDVSESRAQGIVCKEASELVSAHLPAYIDIDNSTAYCLCIHLDKRAFYISLDTIYKMIQTACATE